MAAITYLVFMIIFILILSILDNVAYLITYVFFMIYVATNLNDVLDVPASGFIITEFILITLVLLGFYKIIHVGGKAKKKAEDFLVGEQ